MQHFKAAGSDLFSLSLYLTLSLSLAKRFRHIASDSNVLLGKKNPSHDIYSSSGSSFPNYKSCTHSPKIGCRAPHTTHIVSKSCYQILLQSSFV